MDHQTFEKMAANIPRARVYIDKTRWMRRVAISSYLGVTILGVTAFFTIGSIRIFHPYTHNPTKKIYQAKPDYVNGTISFYEREVPNVITNP